MKQNNVGLYSAILLFALAMAVILLCAILAKPNVVSGDSPPRPPDTFYYYLPVIMKDSGSSGDWQGIYRAYP